MKNFDTFLNACESIKYLDSVTKEGDTYTLIGCGKSLQLKDRLDDKGNHEVLLWSKADPSNLSKVVGADVEKILPRLVVQHFTGIKSSVEFTDHNNHKHLFEDVGFFPESVHSNMVRFSDATGRKWVCSASGGNVPNVTLAFYKLLYDGRTDMSAMMMPQLFPLDDVKVIKSGVGGKQVEVFELPTFPEPSPDFVVSSVDDFKRAIPAYEAFMMFPHQGDVPAYGHSIVSGMVVSSADRPFIASAEKELRGFVGSDYVQTRNKEWGFYGTVAQALGSDIADTYFSKVAEALVGKGGIKNLEQAGKHLDSAAGRHIADWFIGQVGSGADSYTEWDGNLPSWASKGFQDYDYDDYEDSDPASVVSSADKPIRSGIDKQTVLRDLQAKYPNLAPEVLEDIVNNAYTDMGRYEVGKGAYLSPAEAAEGRAYEIGTYYPQSKRPVNLKSLVSSANEVQFQLFDTGAFQLDLSQDNNGSLLCSSIKGTIDAGSILSVASRDGYTFHDLSQGVNLSGSPILSEYKELLVANATLKPVEQVPIKRQLETWVISGKELNKELEKWGLNNPGQVFQSMKVLGIDLAGKDSLPVQSSFDDYDEEDAEEYVSCTFCGREFDLGSSGDTTDAGHHLCAKCLAKGVGDSDIKAYMRPRSLGGLGSSAKPQGSRLGFKKPTASTGSGQSVKSNYASGSELDIAMQYVLDNNIPHNFERVYEFLLDSGLYSDEDDAFDTAFLVCDQLGVPVDSSFKRPVQSSLSPDEVKRICGLLHTDGWDRFVTVEREGVYVSHVENAENELETFKQMFPEYNVEVMPSNIPGDSSESILITGQPTFSSKRIPIQQDFKGMLEMIKNWLQRVHEGLMEQSVFYSNLMRLLKGNGYPGSKANSIYEQLMAGQPVEAVMASLRRVNSSYEDEEDEEAYWARRNGIPWGEADGPRESDGYESDEINEIDEELPDLGFLEQVPWSSGSPSGFTQPTAQ